MNLTHRACLWVFACACAAAPASAQNPSANTAAPPPIAHVSTIDGAASLERDGISEPLNPGLPLLPGDRLRTDAGRIEVLFGDGSALHLDQSTTADILAADLLRLLGGRAYIYAAGSRDPSRAVRYQVDAPGASVQTNWPGQYRILAVGERVELSVVSGEATLATDQGAVTVRAGEHAVASDGQRPTAPAYFNSARWDAFDHWSAARRDERVGAASGQYLPTDLQAYAGTFDQYGTWREEPSVGRVWYPAVAADWRPYYNGYWRPYSSWGSVWIGADPWGWPTHHYGRWGFSVGFGWYWMPDRHWGPGWVAWGSAPGYVSWCPMGRHGGPVFGHWGLRGSAHYPGMDPWRGWTVVPRHAYGRPLPVGRHAIDGRRLEPHVRGAFVAHRESPRIDIAVPRAGAGGGLTARPRPTQPGPPASGSGHGLASATGVDSGATVRRFGRSDGTGLTAPLPLSRSAVPDLAASRRAVPGSTASGPEERQGGGTPFSRAASRPVPPGQTPLEAIGVRESREPRGTSSGTSGIPGPSTSDRSTRRVLPETPGASGMSGASGTARPNRRLPDESPGASGIPGTSADDRSTRRAVPETPGASGMPRATGAEPSSRRPISPTPGASGLPRSNEPPRPTPRRYEAPSSYEAPRSAPRSYSAPPSYEAPRSAPRSYSAPPSYETPRSAPRSYGAPPSYETPRSAPRSYSAPPSYETPRSAPRSYSAPPSYEAPRSAPRSYEAPRSNNAPRSSESSPRYNPGAGSRRDSAPSSAPSRRRSSRDQ